MKLIGSLERQVDIQQLREGYIGVYQKFSEVISQSESYPKIDEKALQTFYGDKTQCLSMGESTLNRSQFLNFLLIIDELPPLKTADKSFLESQTLKDLLVLNDSALR